MSIQMNLLGGVGAGRITAETVAVSAIRINTANAAISFLSNGQQTTTRNGSTSIVANWVTPPFTAPEWEIRAVLDSGDTPSGSAIGSWLPLTSDRTWSLAVTFPETAQSYLTFQFRKLGATLPEATITGNLISAEALDGLG